MNHGLSCEVKVATRCVQFWQERQGEKSWILMNTDQCEPANFQKEEGREIYQDILREWLDYPANEIHDVISQKQRHFWWFQALTCQLQTFATYLIFELKRKWNHHWFKEDLYFINITNLKKIAMGHKWPHFQPGPFIKEPPNCTLSVIIDITNMNLNSQKMS